MPDIAAAPTRAVGFQGSRPTVNAPTVGAAPTLPPTPLASAPTPPPAADVELPADFPADIVMMEGFKVAAVNPAPKAGHNVQFHTERDRDDIYRYYESDLRSKGWQPEQQYEGKDQSFLNFRKGNTMVLLTIANDPRDPGKRVVSLLYYQDDPPEFGDF
jgi:hypothetical protein